MCFKNGRKWGSSPWRVSQNLIIIMNTLDALSLKDLSWINRKNTREQKKDWFRFHLNIVGSLLMGSDWPDRTRIPKLDQKTSRASGATLSKHIDRMRYEKWQYDWWMRLAAKPSLYGQVRICIIQTKSLFVTYLKRKKNISIISLVLLLSHKMLSLEELNFFDPMLFVMCWMKLIFFRGLGIGKWICHFLFNSTRGVNHFYSTAEQNEKWPKL